MVVKPNQSEERKEEREEEKEEERKRKGIQIRREEV